MSRRRGIRARLRRHDANALRVGRRRRGARSPHAVLLPPRPRRPDPVAGVRRDVARAPPPCRAVARRGLRRPARLHAGARRLSAHDVQAPRARFDRGAARPLGRADHPRRRRRRPAGRPRVPLGAAGLCRMGHADRAGQLAARRHAAARGAGARTGAGARRPRISRKLRRAMQIRPFALERYFARARVLAPYSAVLLRRRALHAGRGARAGRRRDARALGRAEPRLHRDGGPPALREEIAALYPGLEADDVLVFAGRGGDLRLRPGGAGPRRPRHRGHARLPVAARGRARARAPR